MSSASPQLTAQHETRWAVLSVGAQVVGLALLTALAAQIRVPLPFTPVPVTLQVFIVILAGYVLGPMAAGSSMIVYVGLGVLGAPVFSGGGAGLATLTGVTGGYLLAYPPAAALVARLSRGAAPMQRILAGLAGLVGIHAAGAAWLALLVPDSPAAPVALLTWSFFPFLGLDIVKVLVAERLTRPWMGRGTGGDSRS